MVQLGNNIIKLRKQNNMKAKQLAQLVGIDQSYLSQIENGKRSPSLEVAQRIAQGLNVTVSELLGEKPPQLSHEMKKLVRISKKLSPQQIDALISVVRELNGKYGSE